MSLAIAIAMMASAGAAPADGAAALRHAVQLDADRRFGELCGTVDLPEEAFLPIDVTGDGNAELLAFLGRGTCAASGGPTGFTGTGGGIIQLWSMRDGRPVMLVDEMMHGLTPAADGFVAFLHGSLCGDYSGASLCVATYKWDGAKSGMRVDARQVYDDAHPGKEPAMRYDWSGSAPE